MKAITMRKRNIVFKDCLLHTKVKNLPPTSKFWERVIRKGLCVFGVLHHVKSVVISLKK